MCEHVRMEARTTLDMFKLYPKPSPAPSIAVKTAEDVKDAIQHWLEMSTPGPAYEAS